MTPTTITISGEGSELIERLKAGVKSKELIDLFGLKFAGVKLEAWVHDAEPRAFMIAQEVIVVASDKAPDHKDRVAGWATDIDWSKAPEGATHYREPFFYKVSDVSVEYHSLRDWVRSAYSPIELTSIAACVELPAPKPWSGDGLPPVGTFVRIADDGSLYYGAGESGEVLAHVEDCAVVRMSYGLGCFTARYLEPIKTAAQFAAELRTATIKRAATLCPYPRADSTLVALEALYDNGLLKGGDQ